MGLCQPLRFSSTVRYRFAENRAAGSGPDPDWTTNLSHRRNLRRLKNFLSCQSSGQHTEALVEFVMGVALQRIVAGSVCREKP